MKNTSICNGAAVRAGTSSGSPLPGWPRFPLGIWSHGPQGPSHCKRALCSPQHPQSDLGACSCPHCPELETEASPLSLEAPPTAGLFLTPAGGPPLQALPHLPPPAPTSLFSTLLSAGPWSAHPSPGSPGQWLRPSTCIQQVLSEDLLSESRQV